MKLTRHNGRSGKHGTYNPRHNDRRFDVENSEHIDAERARQNVYWDCYRGFTTHDFRDNPEQPDFSFEEIERMYYYEHYADHVNAQNARNEKTRHIERNRTVDDLLKNNKTCPEESIYQIGTIEESVSPETLALIVSEFYEEFERRFGSHIHILDWALHLDEGTPHIHERHVFDCENRYGELCPQQEKDAQLRAENLILMTDIAGLLRDKDDPSTLIPFVNVSEVPFLKRKGIISGGMIPKIDCCVEAVRRGVKKTAIIDGRVPHSILIETLSNEGIGTQFR